MIRKDNIYYLLGILIVSILLIISQVILFSKGFYSLSADDAGHTLEAFKWYAGDHSIFSIWLPFQKLLYGIIFSIYYDLFWVPRIISAFFGLLTLLSLIFMTYELFRNKIISILAGLLGAIFPSLVIFSILPMPEIYFFFFIISSIAFYLYWKRTKNSLSLFSSVIFLSICTTIRYEAWIFAFFIFLLIIIEIYAADEILSVKYIKMIGIFLLIFAFPIYWIYLSYHTTGEATSFLHSVSERYSKGGELTEIKNNVLFTFFSMNIASLNIIGILTLLFYYKKKPGVKEYTHIFLLTILSIGLITFITKAMPTHHFWRLASIWSIMLIPFTAKWLYLFLSDEKLYLKYNFILFIILIILSFNSQTSSYTKSSALTKEDIGIGNYINNFLKFNNENSKIYIERNGWEFTSILITSQEPDRFLTNEDISKHPLKYKNLDIEYLILKSKSEDKALTKNYKEVKKFRNWIIYKSD